MKKILSITGILSWVNIVIGSFLVIAGLFTTVMSPNIIMALLSLMLVAAIVLHSYATLQLRKSISNPTIELSSNTPTGIRFMGFVALFFGIMNITNAVALIGNPALIVDQLQAQMPPQLANFNFTTAIKAVGVFVLLFGICIAVNVILSFNLLRWHQNSAQNQQ
jgi:hypothetical protein